MRQSLSFLVVFSLAASCSVVPEFEIWNCTLFDIEWCDGTKMLKVPAGAVSPEFTISSRVWRIRCDEREWVYQMKFPPYEAAERRRIIRRVYRLRLMPGGQITVLWPSEGKDAQPTRDPYDDLIFFPVQTNVIVQLSSADVSSDRNKQ